MKKIQRYIITLILLLSVIFNFTSCDFFRIPGFQENTDQSTGPSTPTLPEKPREERSYPTFGFITDKEPTHIPSIQEDNKIINNLRLGNPMWLIKDNLTEKENYLIERDSYVLSYNDTTHNPNWVSWHLTKDDRGKIKRPSGFYSDPKLPDSWNKVQEEDYQFSTYGFSRGHMCPNADRNGDKTMQHDTFYMTNMVPQVQANNGGPWQKLEEYIQEDLVDTGKEAYIISGPFGIGGEGYNNHSASWFDYIEVDKYGRKFNITVPEYTWKVALVIDEGTADISRLNANTNTEVIAVLMPNSHSDIAKYGKQYEDYKVSVDFIEAITGYDFFANLDNDVEKELEALNKNSATEQRWRKDHIK